jgi:hypothetical protein
MTWDLVARVIIAVGLIVGFVSSIRCIAWAIAAWRRRGASTVSPLPPELQGERWTFAHTPHDGAVLVPGLFELNGKREDGYYDPNGNGALDFLRSQERMDVAFRLVRTPQIVHEKSESGG